MEKVRFYLETDYPLALDSLDYQYPEGAIQDNSRRQKFNNKLKIFPGSVLDLGCAGGGFVKDCIDEGRIAVGLEGTDFNKKEGKFEWITIPDNLFTCDLTKPFILYTEDIKPYEFNIVTAWEFFEHIEKEDIPQVLLNIYHHLIKFGIIICSIDANPYPHKIHREIDLHRTVETRERWSEQFKKFNFVEDPIIQRHFERNWLRQSNSKNNYKFVFRKNE